ncbi:hypothetical protein NQ314_014383 [Rhamnusium bicolor]|uniref:Uncharacterized protein n=1 Tax=Rhamnusium bicolor TaxID=1586634 RepID=A0AAV8X225_9CUCU|nr:hypothetical protein NQ314_014383 [Rhamnusium bicolor]
MLMSRETVNILESSTSEKNIHKQLESPPEENESKINIENNDSKEAKSTSDVAPEGNLSLVKNEELNHEDQAEHDKVIKDISDIEPKLEYENRDSEKEDETVGMKVNTEDKSEEVIEEIKVINENKILEIVKENSQDSLSRPQNLPLKGEGEEPKRKINLIGKFVVLKFCFI